MPELWYASVLVHAVQILASLRLSDRAKAHIVYNYASEKANCLPEIQSWHDDCCYHRAALKVALRIDSGRLCGRRAGCLTVSFQG
jgi:hypothetical protein